MEDILNIFKDAEPRILWEGRIDIIDPKILIITSTFKDRQVTNRLDTRTIDRYVDHPKMPRQWRQLFDILMQAEGHSPIAVDPTISAKGREWLEHVAMVIREELI
jgi:hypothetical protein